MIHGHTLYSLMFHGHRWRIRLVKGISKDRGQAGQRCFCTVCSDDKKEAKRKLTAAQEALKPQDEIDKLENQVKSITPSFMTYDSRVVKYYLQNIPWVGNMLEFRYSQVRSGNGRAHALV